MSARSPLHVHCDPPSSTAATPAEPRPLTLDEQLRVQALRLPFAQARQRVLALVPEGMRRQDLLQDLGLAEEDAVSLLTAAMREA